MLAPREQLVPLLELGVLETPERGSRQTMKVTSAYFPLHPNGSAS
jgi:hypothetical protein